jgi:Asp-tRNA(Asn)/Glu-tRNA(Gln) amidotransferase A subunit family amidase
MLDATVGPDPADPVTQNGADKIPPSFRRALGATSLKGARIAVLTPLFGSAPEDAEVAAIVRTALDRIRRAGADVNARNTGNATALM